MKNLLLTDQQFADLGRLLEGVLVSTPIPRGEDLLLEIYEEMAILEGTYENMAATI